MEVKVKIQTITIKYENTGKVFIVKTLRTAEDIAAFVAESEKDEIVSTLEERVGECIARKIR